MSDLENDDMLTALIAARTQLVQNMELSRGQPYAALFKMYLEVQEKIEKLTPPDVKDTPLDEFSIKLAKKQREREPDSGGTDSATGS
jgi:hypothetical protein